MSHTDSTPTREESIAALIHGLSEQTGTLVRDELALLRQELTEQIKGLGTGAALLGAGGGLAAGAFGAGTAALTASLARHMRTSRAALLVAMVYGGGAAALAAAGAQRLRQAAPAAAETIRRDVGAATTGARNGVSTAG